MDKFIDWIVAKILEKVQSKNSQMNQIKMVYRWKPDKVPETLLPCIWVEPVGTDPQHQVSYDQTTMTLQVWIRIDTKRFYWKDCANTVDNIEILLKKELVKLIQGTDDNCKVLDDSLYWIIRDTPCIHNCINDINLWGVNYWLAQDISNNVYFQWSITIIWLAKVLRY